MDELLQKRMSELRELRDKNQKKINSAILKQQEKLYNGELDKRNFTTTKAITITITTITTSPIITNTSIITTITPTITTTTTTTD